jgi:hypothetical protein
LWEILVRLSVGPCSSIEKEQPAMPPSNTLAVQQESIRQPIAATAVTTPSYNFSIGYLRAFITLLVVTHHAALAYIQFAPEPPSTLSGPNRIWQAFPVVDSQRSAALGLFTGFNDIFFMALMFFLSGLFVWRSLRRKHAASFLRERALRLGLPFAGASAIVAPLAYYPTYIQSRAGGGVAGYWHEWRALGTWPAGPAWFVWVLLAFDAIAAALFLLAPNWPAVMGRISSRASRRPAVFFAILFALSAVAYVPMAVAFNPFRWSVWGPFTFQTSRAVHYLIYFLLGTAIGAYGIERGLLAGDGKLARRWWLWCAAALFAFFIATGTGIATMTAHVGSRAWEVAAHSTFALSCAASSFAFLALFVRFARQRNRIFDSLSENAYGIYLVHYAFVSWMQLALLQTQLPAIAKACIVFASAVLLSWGTVALLRRVPLSLMFRRRA